MVTNASRACETVTFNIRLERVIDLERARDSTLRARCRHGAIAGRRAYGCKRGGREREAAAAARGRGIKQLAIPGVIRRRLSGTGRGTYDSRLL